MVLRARCLYLVEGHARDSQSEKLMLASGAFLALRDVLVAGNSLEPHDPILRGKLRKRLRVILGQRQSA